MPVSDSMDFSCMVNIDDQMEAKLQQVEKLNTELVST